MEKRPLSKLAVVGLMLSTIAIISTTMLIIIYVSDTSLEFPFTLIVVVPFITSIPAIIIGIVALRQIKRNYLKGKGIAIVSLISAIFILLFISSFLVYGTFFSSLDEYNNDISAIVSLKSLIFAEKYWFREDCDGNGIKDYWTYDISCLYRIYRRDNSTKFMFIDLCLAKADMAPASMVGGTIPFGIPQIEPWTNVKTEAKAGYRFQAMVEDDMGIPYNQNPVGPNNILATNKSKYAFVAYPDWYGISGIGTYILNEKGQVYSQDMGSDANKIVLRWPKPTELEGKKSKWHGDDY